MPHGRSLGVVVYSPANLNAIDGSSIWSQTIVLALAEAPNVQVSILLSHKITNERILRPLLERSDINVIDPFSERLTRSNEDALPLDEAARILGKLVRQGSDVVVVRGLAAALRLSAESSLEGRLLPYLTDVPQRVGDMNQETTKSITRIMSASPALLCQTEEFLAFMASNYPAVMGKVWLLPPIVPDAVRANRLSPPTASDLRLCYSGKFARRWNTLEMCRLPTQLAIRGITATLTMVGDKINRDPDDPRFVGEMREALETSPGVDWVGGVSRARSLELMSQAHIGLSWRSPELDDSLELSTKLLEYCANGTPPILNRTPMHERVFTPDYSLFVDDSSHVLDVLTTLVTSPEPYLLACQQVSTVASRYSATSATEGLVRLFERIEPTLPDRSGRWARKRPRKSP